MYMEEKVDTIKKTDTLVTILIELNLQNFNYEKKRYHTTS